MNAVKKINWFAVGIFALCLISRLPQVLSPYFHADYNGDECVLGLMAKHMAEGKEFPFYFWGQSYGFSTLEAGAVAIAIKLFGINLYSLKIPMLVLWSLGCVFFYLALSIWTSRLYGFGISILLILSPAWMGWSLRARAGYVTAFLLTNLALFLTARYGRSMTKTVSCWLGLLAGFIFYAQPAFVLGLLPIVLYLLWQQRGVKQVLMVVVGFMAVFVLGKIMIYVQGNTSFWKAHWFRVDPFMDYLVSFKTRLFYALNQDAGNHWPPVIVSDAWCWVLLAGVVGSLIGFWKKNVHGLTLPLLIGMLLVLACTIFVDCEDQWRYLLPLDLFLIFWIGVLFYQWVEKYLFFRIGYGLFLSFFIMAGVFICWDYRGLYVQTSLASDGIPEMQKISTLISFLESAGVKDVFALDDDISWKLIYFSKEEIKSRWAICTRQPAYYNAVNQAFLNGEKVAIVGDVAHEGAAVLFVADVARPIMVANPYFVYLNPSSEVIFDRLRFSLQ